MDQISGSAQTASDRELKPNDELAPGRRHRLPVRHPEKYSRVRGVRQAENHRLGRIVLTV
jgi:hypothetical protein